MASPWIRLRAGLFVILVIAIAELSGCTPAPTPCYPVSGKVTLNKKPLATGVVTFSPDASKGNSSKEGATGFIEEDGTYTVVTNGRNGAPLGWYKVSVSPVGMPKDMGSGKKPPKPPPMNAKYKKADTSGISIEVTENPKPGAYDIELK